MLYFILQSERTIRNDIARIVWLAMSCHAMWWQSRAQQWERHSTDYDTGQHRRFRHCKDVALQVQKKSSHSAGTGTGTSTSTRAEQSTVRRITALSSWCTASHDVQRWCVKHRSRRTAPRGLRRRPSRPRTAHSRKIVFNTRVLWGSLSQNLEFWETPGNARTFGQVFWN